MDEPNKNSSAFDVNIRLIKICNIYMKIIKWKSLFGIWRLEYSFFFSVCSSSSILITQIVYYWLTSNWLHVNLSGFVWLFFYSLISYFLFFCSLSLYPFLEKKKSRQINQQFTNCTTIEWNVSNHGDSWMADIWNWKYWIFFLHLFNVIRCWTLEMAFAHESCKWKNVRVSRIISIELKKISAHIKCLCRFDFAGIFEACPSKIHTHVFLWCNGVLY